MIDDAPSRQRTRSSRSAVPSLNIPSRATAPPPATTEQPPRLDLPLAGAVEQYLRTMGVPMRAAAIARALDVPVTDPRLTRALELVVLEGRVIQDGERYAARSSVELSNGSD